MSRYTVSLLILWPLAALASQKDSPRDTARVMTIYTKFAHPPAAISVERMKAELDTIMAPWNLRFDWRSLEQARGDQVMASLVVVTFRGACQPDDLPPLSLQRGPLGWTHIASGEILPFADVDCDRIRDLMTHSLSPAPPPERERLLGRAMARVLAHELYHLLLHTSEHASTGIAKATYSGADLAAQQLLFDEAQLRAVSASQLRRVGAVLALR